MNRIETSVCSEIMIYEPRRTDTLKLDIRETKYRMHKSNFDFTYWKCIIEAQPQMPNVSFHVDESNKLIRCFIESITWQYALVQLTHKSSESLNSSLPTMQLIWYFYLVVRWKETTHGSLRRLSWSYYQRISPSVHHGDCASRFQTVAIHLRLIRWVCTRSAFGRMIRLPIRQTWGGRKTKVVFQSW